MGTSVVDVTTLNELRERFMNGVDSELLNVIEGNLMPRYLKERFHRFPIGSQQEKGLDAKIVVRFYNLVTSEEWLITEGEEQENGDWKLFGYFYNSKWEWGSVMLSELETKRVSLSRIRRDRGILFSKVSDFVHGHEFRQRFAV